MKKKSAIVAIFAVFSLLFIAFRDDPAIRTASRPILSSSNVGDSEHTRINEIDIESGFPSSTRMNDTATTSNQKRPVEIRGPEMSDAALEIYKHAMQSGWSNYITKLLNGDAKLADINDQDRNRLTRLSIPFISAHEVRKLLEAGIQLPDDALFLSISNGLKTPEGDTDEKAIVEKLDILLQYGNTYDVPTYFFSDTTASGKQSLIFDRAARFGHLTVMDFLWNRGFFPSQKLLDESRTRLPEQSQRYLETKGL